MELQSESIYFIALVPVSHPTEPRLPEFDAGRILSARGTSGVVCLIIIVHVYGVKISLLLQTLILVQLK